MTFLKLLLSSSIIYLAVMAIAKPMDGEESKIKGVKIDESKIMRSVLNDKSSNISDYIFPIRYKIKLMLQNNYLQSECIITLNISYAKQYISFYAPNSMNIIASKLEKNNSMIGQIKSIHRVKNNILVLDFGDDLLHGMYDLYIEFIIPINITRESFGTPYINKDGKIEWLIATGIQRRNKCQTEKQQIFPYWDNPELRITFLISIMHYPKYKALSNMQIQDTEWTYNYMMWTHFYETPLISIDNVAFLISGFQQSIVSNEIIRSFIWFRPQSKSHLEFAKTVISSISVYIRNWNILRKELERTSVLFVDHVVIPDLKNEIEQTLGFIFYREADITYNQDLDSVAYKPIIASLIARGMVQKYISEPTYLWPHTWLIDGFNVFLQAFIIDKALPNSQMMDLFVVQVQHELLYINTYVVINSTMEYNSYPEKYFHSSLSAIKGSIIWRMLERTLSSDIFSIRMNKYNQTMQKYPTVLKVTRDYLNDVVTASVEFYDKLDEENHYIPVTYTTESNPNFTILSTNIWLTSWNTKAIIFLEKNQWIIFNLQQAGYYRVNYDIVNWRKIAQYLNSKEYSNIHVLNRAQIINDAFHFAIEKKLEFSIFWELASYLEQERDYIAWYPMFKAFEILSNIFPFLDFYPEFKRVLRFDFMQAFKLRHLNLNEESYMNDHTKCLKQELIRWKCIINENSCEEESKSYLKWHLANPKENKILPGWKRWTYCNGLKTADGDTWNKAFNDYTGRNDTTLECLAYSRNPIIIINYLKIILPEILLKPRYNLPHIHLEPTERAYALTANIFLSVFEKNTNYMLRNLLSNYKIIRHSKVNEIVTLIVIINNAYSKKQLDEIKKFVKEELKNSIISNVENKIETRWLEIEKQINYFQSLFNIKIRLDF